MAAKQISKFLKNTRANVALIFALLAMPLVVLTGSAIELSRVNGAASELQGITDAAVLAAVQASPTANDVSKSAADLYLKSHIVGTNIKVDSTAIGQTKKGENTQLNYTARGKIDTYLLKLIGKDTLEVSATSSATANSGESELVFVLDTTGSMAMNNKMIELKKAVNSALDSLTDGTGANVNKLKIGVVPFNTQVKVDPSTMTQVNSGFAGSRHACNVGTGPYDNYLCDLQWVNTDTICNDSTSPVLCRANIRFFESPVVNESGKNSVEQIAVTYEQVGSTYLVRMHYIKFNWVPYTCSNLITTESGTTCVNWDGSVEIKDETQTDYPGEADLSKYDTIPAGYALATDFRIWNIHTTNGFAANSSETWDYITINSEKRIYLTPPTPAQQTSWAGCFVDRFQDFDVSAESPTTMDPKSQYRAKNCQYEPLEPILPMTLDISQVRNKVNSFAPAGNTNITIGVQWGMEVLSPTLPFAEGSKWRDKEHAKFMIILTDGENTANDFTTKNNEIDKRTELACENAKKQGIIVFVIRLEEGDSSLLKKCASTNDNYYDLNNASGLTATFKDIFKSMNRLRIVE